MHCVHAAHAIASTFIIIFLYIFAFAHYTFDTFRCRTHSSQSVHIFLFLLLFSSNSFLLLSLLHFLFCIFGYVCAHSHVLCALAMSSTIHYAAVDSIHKMHLLCKPLAGVVSCPFDPLVEPNSNWSKLIFCRTLHSLYWVRLINGIICEFNRNMYECPVSSPAGGKLIYFS